MPTITPGKFNNPIDRNPISQDRQRRNWQRLSQGGVNQLIQVDGTSITMNSAGQLATKYVVIFNEIPGGTIDGTNATFMLGNPVVDDTLLVFVNGLQMIEGDDYSVSGNTFTFVTGAIPQSGDSIRVTYET